MSYELHICIMHMTKWIAVAVSFPLHTCMRSMPWQVSHQNATVPELQALRACNPSLLHLPVNLHHCMAV